MHWTIGGYIGLVAIGCGIGIFSGMLGIGGGVLVIPALTFIFGFTQQMAVGTSLGMLLPPIGIFAFLNYYKSGQVNLPAAGLLAAGFAVGALLGALIVTHKLISPQALRIPFAFFLIYVAGNILFRSETRVAAVTFTIIRTAGLMIAFAATFFIFRLLGKRWEKSLAVTHIYGERLQQSLAPDYEI